MKSRQRIGVTQTQRLHLTTGLATSIRMLGLGADDLTRFLEEQSALNPALSLKPPAPAREWTPRWKSAIAAAAAPQPEAASADPSLMAHVMQQILSLTTPGPQRDIAIALADALEPSGWLGQPLPEIAAACGAPLREVEAVLRLLQGMEPTGIFARSLSECLLMQAEEEGLADPAMRCMFDRLDLVASGDIGQVARHCAISSDEAASRLRLLRRFDPKPGARFGPGSAVVREPDLIAERDGDDWLISLNRSALPTLRVARAGQDHMREARELSRFLENRNSTLLRVAREMMTRQRAALEHGPKMLAPMRMADIAEALGLHESTISRVVAGAAMDTPHGTIWLRRLFTGRVGDANSPAAAEVRAALSRLIAAEDNAAPLSDQALCNALQAEGLPVARRTLAKYRGMLNIPPAHRRRRR